jgi:hypothetical protein
MYFNTFDLDRDSEPGFLVARFAFVRWGECLDCLTVLIPRVLVDAGREGLLKYVKEVGFEVLGSDFKVTPVPRFIQGAVETADIINVARSGDVGEISMHGFALQEALEASKDPKKRVNAEPLAFLRSSTSLQIKWIMTLYDQD